MIPVWALSLPWPEITRASETFQIPPFLIAAIISVESNGQPHATRFEPNYRWLLKPEAYAKDLGITLDTEKLHQMTSWGLMQIMGATAREVGFHGYLTELTDPRLGIEMGCRYLSRQLGKYSGIEAIAAYNAGSPRYVDGRLVNEKYVDKVLMRVNALKGNSY